MNEYTMNQKEAQMLKKIKQILDTHPELMASFTEEGIHPMRLWEPCDTYYILDRSLDKTVDTQRLCRLLERHRAEFRQVDGRMTTQTTEEWERYPLDALLRLIWRLREVDGEVTFMRGGVADNKPLTIWKAETYSEQGNRVLRCYDEQRSHYMYAVLRAPNFSLSKQEFFEEMRDFLDFEEGTIWVSSGTTFGILEVSE